MSQQPPVLNIMMVPAGVELVLAALNQSTLPHAQVAPLLAEIAGQAQFQLGELVKAETAKLEKAVAKAPKQPRKKVKAVETPPADDPDSSDVLA